MKPQLTLHTPLELPYMEISNYLNKLWISEDKDNSGANTFTLMIWQPAWLEQCLVQKGLVNGPITGNFSPEIIEVAKKFSNRCDLKRIPCVSSWTKKQAEAIKTN